MKKTKHAPEQIVKKLREAEVELAKGATVAMVTKKLGVTEQTYYRWKRQYGSMDVDHLARLKELERENSRLKKIVAEQARGHRGIGGDRDRSSYFGVARVRGA